MKTIEEFLSYLSNLDVELRADGERLHCNAPKGTLTPALRTELAERKPEILTFLHKVNLAAGSAQEQILPVPRHGNLPLSFGQQRLWFLDQLEGKSSTYNEFQALKINGSLRVDALEMAVQEIVRRHEVLRTTFPVLDGAPVQAIAPSTAVKIPVVDLQHLPEVEQSALVQRLAHEEQTRPFGLASGPLLRITLLRLGSESHVLLVTMHHIISDSWTIGVLNQEFAALYEAFSAGKPSSLPELPIQFVDFAHWQRQWMQGKVLESQLAYWKQQLTGIPLLELPTDRPRSAAQTFLGATQSLELAKTLTEKLKALSRREGVTLFMTLLAAFNAMLHYYTSQNDIVVGTDVANRNRAETEGLIGFFVNQLVLRTDLSSNPTFRELLRRVREMALGAYAHQDLPFDKLVHALRPERNLSRNPLFQVVFGLLNTPMQALKLSGLTVNTLELDKGTTVFDLSLQMMDTEQGLVGWLQYNTDLFEPATITQMLGHFETLLCHVVTQPDARLNALVEILAEADRQQTLIKQKEFKETCRRKLKSVKPRPIMQS